MSEIEERLAELERNGLDRRLRMVSGPQGPTVLLDGRPVLLLCSNNYLGLADHPRVREAAAEAAMRWGVGAGASRLVSGTMTIHRRLEERLAAFERSEACLLFGSGYLANIGVIGALAGPGDTVFSDELNHASIIDGCRLSRAEVVVYRHADPDHLAFSLRRHGGRGGRLIVTDSVFSMDGDLAPLKEIVELASAYGARTMVDEAHATGALGADGRGALARAGLTDEVDVLVGTLGKALGSYGAYVCADSQTVRYLVNTARPLIFSTAPPPPALAAALAALELLQESPHRVERLRSNALLLRRELAAVGFSVAEEGMHIVPLIVGEERMTMRLCQEAIERGVFAQAIRPPTVAAGTSRMRLAVMASHTASELRTAARVLGEAAHAVGLDPAEIGTPLREREVADVAPSVPVLETPSADPEPFSLGVEREAPETGPNPGRARLAAAARSRSEGPFDLEQLQAAGDAAPAGGAHEPDAPFDIERETAVQRAA
ncbi:MAG: 8-amino-7-oxononanoate synthase [Solirubrobacteraceae bacterium]